MKNLTKRYVSEESVKEALKVDSFRNMSRESMMQFASIIPHMDKDVAIAIINQVPVFTDFAKTAIELYTQVCTNILENNKGSQEAVIKGYQTILDTLSKLLEKENISEVERKSIIDDMIAVANKIAEADLNNKKLLVGCSMLAVLVVLGVAVILKDSSFDNGNL